VKVAFKTKQFDSIKIEQIGESWLLGRMHNPTLGEHMRRSYAPPPP